jgi:hypothetical protein
MTLQAEYNTLLGMADSQNKRGEVARKIREKIAGSAGIRIAGIVRSGQPFATLISDPTVMANRDMYDAIILEAISETITNPQSMVHEYGALDSSNAELNESMLEKGPDPSELAGGRKRKTRKRKNKRKLRKTRHRR